MSENKPKRGAPTKSPEETKVQVSMRLAPDVESLRQAHKGFKDKTAYIEKAVRFLNEEWEPNQIQ